MSLLSDRDLYGRDPVISDDEYCVDCGENASCYRFGVALCNSCAMADIDDMNEVESDDDVSMREGGFC